MRIHNRKYLEQRRRDLRNNGTSAEATLWRSLQRKQLGGRKFRRQHSIKNYIVDFYCFSEKLVIELDGDYHYSGYAIEQDQRRDEGLNRLGIKVLRFENDEVFWNLEGVLERIAQEFTSPGPS